MCILLGEATPIFFLPLSDQGPALTGTICSFERKILPLRVDPYGAKFFLYEYQQ